MTNTLHRFGKPESLEDDFIVFVLASRVNYKGAPERVNKFLKAALKYNPVNIGNGTTGAMYQPEDDLSFAKVYFSGRKEKLTSEEIIKALEKSMAATVVFDNRESFAGFLKEVKEMDLGLSINASALADETRDACAKGGITIHSVEYSLGFLGDLYRLPDRHTLALTTMCGHGMISGNFARKLIDRVKEARLTPEKAAGYMAKFCACGAFNTSRAVHILNEARMAN